MSVRPGWQMTRRRLLALTGSALVGGEAAAGASAPATWLVRLPLDPRDAVLRDGWRTFAPLRVGRGASVIGVGWARSSPDRLELRTHAPGRGWGDWVPVATHAHATESDRAMRASDPVAIAGATRVQLRARGTSSGLIARLVRVDAAAAAASARAARAGDGAPLRTDTARARPAILPRSAWGGNGVRPRNPPSFGSVQAGFVHHTVSANSYGPDESAALVLGIARYHRDANGWDDLGYNFVVDRYGRIFEGRAGGVERAVVGAHAQGYNTQSTGVAVLGTFTDVAAPAQALEAVAQLLAWKLALHGAPAGGSVTVVSGGGAANRYPAGTPVTLQRVCGHRDGGLTECPGTRLYAQLPGLRQRAAALQASVYRNVRATPVAVAARAASRRVTAGKAVLMRGTRDPSGPVDVLVERRRNKRYRRVRTIRARSRRGRFSMRIPLRRAGLYRLTAIADGSRAAPVLVRATKRRHRG